MILTKHSVNHELPQNNFSHVIYTALLKYILQERFVIE